MLGGGPYGMGLFHSTALAKAVPQDLSDRHRMDLAEIWNAFLEPSPVSFFALVDRCAPDHVGYRMSHLRNRFPSRTDGLTHWERALLRSIGNYPGQPVARAIGDVIGRSDISDCPGQIRLLDWAFALAEAGLLSVIRQEGPRERELSTTYFSLTELGNDVLAEKRNRLELADFDCWFGGTYMTAGNRWWLDGNAIVRDA